MYAVVQTGGKQYRVTAGSVIEVEKLEGDAGATIALANVLALSNGAKTVLGSPLISEAKVNAEIIGQGKGEKVIIFKKKRRHNYRRKNGHRQLVTTLHITDILFKGESLVSAEPRGVTVKPAAKTAEKAEPAAKATAKAKAKTEKSTAKAAEKKPAAKKAAPAKKAAASTEKAKPAAKKAPAKKPAAKKKAE